MSHLSTFILFTAGLVAGCNTTEFTQEGRDVRTITPNVAQDCEHLGLVSSFKPVVQGGLTAAQLDIRNKVGSLGANAMVVVLQQVDPAPYQHGRITAEAYRCDFKKKNS
jgi:hypothetical protein